MTPSGGTGSSAAADFHGMMESVPAPISVLSAIREGPEDIVDFTLEYMNLASQDLIGVDRSQLIGRSIKDLVPNLVESGLFDDYASVARDGGVLVKGPFPFEGTIAGETLSGYFDIHVARYGDGVLVLSLDATAGIRAHERLIEAEADALQREETDRKTKELAAAARERIARANEALESDDRGNLRSALEGAKEAIDRMAEGFGR